MRIEPNSGIARAAGIQATTPPPKTAKTEPNMVDLANANALDAALKATPDVRTEAVARAKALIQDPAYPSADVVNQVATAVAKGIRGPE